MSADHKADHNVLVRATISEDTIAYLDTNVIEFFAERTAGEKRSPGPCENDHPRNSVSHLAPPASHNASF